MSDLISRSELINEFNNKNIHITFDLPVEEILGEDLDLDDFAMLVQDAIQVYKKMVIDIIKNQPTAYSVDKVVEEINNMRFDFQEVSNNKYRVLKIVKQGGVSDDVCEWHCDEYGRWHTECHYLADNDPLEYTYCPYCGKKIKVVE